MRRSNPPRPRWLSTRLDGSPFLLNLEFVDGTPAPGNRCRLFPSGRRLRGGAMANQVLVQLRRSPGADLVGSGAWYGACSTFPLTTASIQIGADTLYPNHN